MHDVIIVGGGISGMTAAFLLQKSGRDVLVLEEKSEPGGHIRTLSEKGVRMETGPHSFMGSSEFTWKLVEDLEMGESVMPASPSSKNRYIFRNESLTPLPMGLSSFIRTPLLSWPAKLRLMMEPFIPNGAQEDDTAWDFFCRRFGREAANFIMSPFVSGVYAGDVKMLGARAAFPKFWNFEKDSGSMIWGAVKYMRNKKRRLKREGIEPKKGLFSFNGGLGNITQILAERLRSGILLEKSVTGVHKVENGYKVESGGESWKARAVVLATPPSTTASLLEGSLNGMTDDLKKIPMSPVALIHWRAREDNHTFPDGFGFLMPRLFEYRVLGTLFPSRLFPNRVSDGWQLFASFYGGMTDPGAVDLSDDALIELLLDEHRRIFHTTLDGVEILRILRYSAAIPQLLPDHPERIMQFREILKKKMPGIDLAGNYLTGVGIEHAIESGYAAYDRIHEFLAN
ncbi:MAG: protoporphyrinogen oxidase [Acidobacteria bacterium]|nr:protoporphyrinogen oxidase [Acidobacteriota bacterium]MCG2815202.1 protoporphyrinogen oxidase [Candidatus Aminicenantes bacterium]